VGTSFLALIRILLVFFGSIYLIGCGRPHQVWSVEIPCGAKTLIINEIDVDTIDHSYQYYYLNEKNGWFSKTVRIGEINNFFPFNFARLSDVHYLIFNNSKPVWGKPVFCLDPEKVTEQEFEEIGQSLSQNFNKIPNLNLQGIIYGTVDYFKGDASNSPVHFDCSKVDPAKRYIYVYPVGESEAYSSDFEYKIVFGKNHSLPAQLIKDKGWRITSPLERFLGSNFDKCVNPKGQNIFDYYDLNTNGRD